MFVIENYGGLIKEVKNKYIDKKILFNIKDTDTKSKTSTFKILNPITINEGAGARDDCGYIARECPTADNFSVTADESLSVNAVFGSCDLRDISQEEKAEELKNVSVNWSQIEISKAYKKMFAEIENITADVTTNLPAEANTKDEILYHVKKMTDLGYDRKDLIVVVNDDVQYELDQIDIACCDPLTNTRDSLVAMNNKIRTKALVNLPNSWLKTEAGDNVRIAVYVYEYALYKEYCKNDVVMRNIQDPDHPATTLAQIIGAEDFTLKMYNPTESGVYSLATTPVV